MAGLNVMRHLDIFDPEAFGDRQVGVIGAGATGSRVVVDLAKLGVKNIHVWDFDTVEAHNVPNQAYGIGDIGKLKVEALRNRVKADTGTEISIHNEKVDGSTSGLGDVVFLLVDKMDVRREIWDGALKFQPYVSLVIETRMNPFDGRIYAINPNKLEDIELWEGNCYADSEAPRSACGATSTLGPVAGLIAELALLQFVRWFAIQNGADDKLEPEALFFGKPLSIMANA